MYRRSHHFLLLQGTGGNSGITDAVSYTHLDVYKRQILYVSVCVVPSGLYEPVYELSLIHIFLLPSLGAGGRISDAGVSASAL